MPLGVVVGPAVLPVAVVPVVTADGFSDGMASAEAAFEAVRWFAGRDFGEHDRINSIKRAWSAPR